MAQNFGETSQLPRVAATPDSLPVENRADLHDARILVIDDELDARRIVSIVLRAAGALVYAAHNKDEALLLADHNTFDAVITDISMPGGDGISLVEELRKRGHKMPAIALSALPLENIQECTREVDFALHIEKPVELSALTAAVAGVIQRKLNA